MTFDDKLFDESEHQRLVARSLGLNSNEVRCGKDDIYANFPDVVYHAESPLFRTAPVADVSPQSARRASGVKVVLTGEGSDEIAWGYDIFREAKLRRFWSRQPESRARPQLFKKLYAYLPQFQNPRHFQLARRFLPQGHGRRPSSRSIRIRRALPIPAPATSFSVPALQTALRDDPPEQALIDSLPPDFARRSLLEKCQYLEMRTLLHGYLLNSQGDRMFSAHGVEGRFPYLDHHVIEFLAGVPERFRLRGLKDKAILRETFRRDLPREHRDRPKFAFRAPELAVFLKDPDGMVAYHLERPGDSRRRYLRSGGGAPVPSPAGANSRRAIFHPRQSGLRANPLHADSAPGGLSSALTVATNRGWKNDVIVTRRNASVRIRSLTARDGTPAAGRSRSSDALFPLPLYAL